MQDIKSIIKEADSLLEKISTLDEKTKTQIGDKAFELIGDYPIYASSCNISYEEAILIGMVLFGEEILEDRIDD